MMIWKHDLIAQAYDKIISWSHSQTENGCHFNNVSVRCENTYIRVDVLWFRGDIEAVAVPRHPLTVVKNLSTQTSPSVTK